MPVLAFLYLLAVKAAGPGSGVLPSQGQQREVETQCLHFVTVAAAGPHPASQILNWTELWKPQVAASVTKSLGKCDPNRPQTTSLYLSQCMNIHRSHCRGINMFDYCCCPTGVLCNVWLRRHVPSENLEGFTRTSGLRRWGKRRWLLIHFIKVTTVVCPELGQRRIWLSRVPFWL